MIARPADRAVTLSRLPFHISDRRGRGSELYNGFDGHRMSVLMARHPASWQPRPRGWHTDMHPGHWKLRHTSRPVARGSRRCTELQQPLIWRLFWERFWNLGQRVLVPCEAEKRNSSFCLRHYRRYLCEIDTIRAEITNRFLKWVLCPYNFANLTIKMFSVYSSFQVLMIFELLW